MNSTLTNLRASLDSAVDMIDESLLLPKDSEDYSSVSTPNTTQLDFSCATSLLEKCDNVDEQYSASKPVIRVIHHFACSGGTLVSKCLSAMPNVFLLSEVHPHSNLQKNKNNAQYSPSDISKLSVYADVPDHNKLAKEVFRASVKAAYTHIDDRGGVLILRDHTHSDYCVGSEVQNNIVSEILNENFQINSLVTLRNPVDSYLSLVANGWVHHLPATFDEYCKRLLLFLTNFSNKQIILYENFVNRPQKCIKEMCDRLEIPFGGDFEAIFDLFSVTGDSGRKGNVIEERDRRELSEEILLEIRSSENFKKIVSQFPEYRVD